MVIFMLLRRFLSFKCVMYRRMLRLSEKMWGCREGMRSLRTCLFSVFVCLIYLRCLDGVCGGISSPVVGGRPGRRCWGKSSSKSSPSLWQYLCMLHEFNFARLKFYIFHTVLHPLSLCWAIFKKKLKHACFSPWFLVWKRPFQIISIAHNLEQNWKPNDFDCLAVNGLKLTKLGLGWFLNLCHFRACPHTLCWRLWLSYSLLFKCIYCILKLCVLIIILFFLWHDFRFPVWFSVGSYSLPAGQSYFLTLTGWFDCDCFRWVRISSRHLFQALLLRHRHQHLRLPAAAWTTCLSSPQAWPSPPGDTCPQKQWAHTEHITPMNWTEAENVNVVFIIYLEWFWNIWILFMLVWRLLISIIDSTEIRDGLKCLQFWLHIVFLSGVASGSESKGPGDLWHLLSPPRSHVHGHDLHQQGSAAHDWLCCSV